MKRITNGDTINVYATVDSLKEVNDIVRHEFDAPDFLYEGGDVKIKSFYAHGTIKETDKGYEVFLAKPKSWEVD